MRELQTERDGFSFEEAVPQHESTQVVQFQQPGTTTVEPHPVPVNRLGTAHRIETLRLAGILGKRYGTVVDIGGFDGAISSRIDADERIVVEPHLPDESLRSANVRYIESDGSKAPLDDGMADLVLLLDVLEHVERPEELLSEALRVLKPDGRGVLTVPSSDIRIFPWFLQNWADRRWDHTIRRGYRPGDLEDGIAAAGGSVVRTLDMGCIGFRMAYLPVSVMWRLWQPAAHSVLKTISRFDYKYQKLGAGRGYIFVEFRRSE